MAALPHRSNRESLVAQPPSCSAAAMASPEKVSAKVLAPAALSLSVGADGTPSNVACGPEVVPSIGPLLVRAISAWKFAPGQRDKVATAMSATLSLNLALVPKQGGYGLQATRATLKPAMPPTAGASGPVQRKHTPPRYPRDEQLSGRTGLVVLELLLQAGSDVPRIGQTWFDGEPATVSNGLVKAAMDVAQHWQIEHMPEQVGLCVPVAFTLHEPIALNGSDPCKDTYVPGFAPPTLITDATKAAF